MNDALAVYFLDATIASAFVARWCAIQRIEMSMEYIGSGMTSRQHGLGRACIRHPEGHLSHEVTLAQ